MRSAILSAIILTFVAAVPCRAESLRTPSFHPSVAAEGAAFLRLFAVYRSAALSFLTSRWGSKPQSLSYETLDDLNWEAHTRNQAAYDEAIAAADRLIDVLRERGRWSAVDPAATHVILDKGTALLSVVVTATDETILCVPIAYGANPDGGTKQRDGDLRTPETPVELCSPATTPHFITTRARETVAKGMTVRCMGLGSRLPEDAYWVSDGWNVAIHGSPARWSMGLRASHGCARVIEGHVVHVYALTAQGTPVIILGTGIPSALNLLGLPILGFGGLEAVNSLD